MKVIKVNNCTVSRVVKSGQGPMGPMGPVGPMGPIGPTGPNTVTSDTASDGTADLSVNTLEVLGTLTANHIHGNLAGSVYAHVRAGEALAKGDPVYVSGSHGSGSTLIPIVSRADAEFTSKMPAVGVMDADVAANANGHMVITGAITEIDTANYPVNAELYVDIGGGVTTTPPHINVQPVGRVERSNTNNGAFIVKVNGLSSTGGWGLSDANKLVRFGSSGTIPSQSVSGVLGVDLLSMYPEESKVAVWSKAYKVITTTFFEANGVYQRESTDYNGRPYYRNAAIPDSYIRWNGAMWELYDGLGALAVIAYSPIDSQGVPTTGWYSDGGNITVTSFFTINGLGEAAFLNVADADNVNQNQLLVRSSDPRMTDQRHPLAHSHGIITGNGYIDGITAADQVLISGAGGLIVTVAATSSSTANTLVKRSATGSASFTAITVSGSTNSNAGNFTASGVYSAVSGQATASGFGGSFSASSGTALKAETSTGELHALFGSVNGNNRSFIRRVLGLIGWYRGISNFTQVFGSPDTLTAHRDVRLPDASGTVALTSDLNSYAKLSGGNIIIGNQTISGQVEIVGQANNTPNSALTTLLGRLDPLNVMEYQLYPQLPATAGVSTVATGDGANNSNVSTPISISSGNNTGASMTMRAAQFITQNIGGSRETVNFEQKMLVALNIRSSRNGLSGIAYISWPMPSTATTGLLSNKGFGWKQTNGLFYGVTHDGITLRETTGFAETTGLNYNLAIYNDGLGNYSFYVNGTLLQTIIGPVGTYTITSPTATSLVMHVINPVGGSGNSIALAIQNLTMKSWL